MRIRVLSWNVEEFDGQANQLDKVVDLIQDQDPDLFALYEVEDIDVLDLMRDDFGGYDFNITDGPQNKEILVGHRRNTFDQVVFSQKREFKAYNPRLRPGAFLSVRVGTEFFNFLFLHTDAGTLAKDFGNRFEMFEKIWSLKGRLDRMNEPRPGNLVVMGDLNTMGLQYPRRLVSHRLVGGGEEVEAVRHLADRAGMRILKKEFDITYNNLRVESDLDHALASEHMSFRTLGNREADGEPFAVRVRGWHQLGGQARRRFIEHISDHSALIVELET